MRRYPPLVVLAWVYALSGWTFLLLWPGSAGWVPAEVSRRSWLSMAMILALPTSLSYLLNIWALGRVSASTTAVYVFSQPLIAGVAGILAFDERPSLSMAFAALAIFLGIGLVVPSRR